jgi:hypothetical protein
MDQCQKDWERERREMIALFQVFVTGTGTNLKGICYPNRTEKGYSPWAQQCCDSGTVSDPTTSSGEKGEILNLHKNSLSNPYSQNPELGS